MWLSKLACMQLSGLWDQLPGEGYLKDEQMC